jgi:hypothetical protein
MDVFWAITLMMEAVRTSETSIYFETSRCHIPEVCYLHTHGSYKCTSHKKLLWCYVDGFSVCNYDFCLLHSLYATSELKIKIRSHINSCVQTPHNQPCSVFMFIFQISEKYCCSQITYNVRCKPNAWLSSISYWFVFIHYNSYFIRTWSNWIRHISQPPVQDKTKAKAVPLHAIKALGGERRYSSYSFSTSALDGGESSALGPGRALPSGRTHGTHWTGGWVGPRAGLDTEDRGKILCLCRGSNLDRPVVQSVVRHYTAWATRLTIQKTGSIM